MQPRTVVKLSMFAGFLALAVFAVPSARAADETSSNILNTHESTSVTTEDKTVVSQTETTATTDTSGSVSISNSNDGPTGPADGPGLTAIIHAGNSKTGTQPEDTSAGGTGQGGQSASGQIKVTATVPPNPFNTATLKNGKVVAGALAAYQPASSYAYNVDAHVTNPAVASAVPPAPQQPQLPFKSLNLLQQITALLASVSVPILHAASHAGGGLGYGLAALMVFVSFVAVRGPTRVFGSHTEQLARAGYAFAPRGTPQVAVNNLVVQLESGFVCNFQIEPALSRQINP